MDVLFSCCRLGYKRKKKNQKTRLYRTMMPNTRADGGNDRLPLVLIATMQLFLLDDNTFRHKPWGCRHKCLGSLADAAGNVHQGHRTDVGSDFLGFNNYLVSAIAIFTISHVRKPYGS